MFDDRALGPRVAQDDVDTGHTHHLHRLAPGRREFAARLGSDRSLTYAHPVACLERSVYCAQVVRVLHVLSVLPQMFARSLVHLV